MASRFTIVLFSVLWLRPLLLLLLLQATEYDNELERFPFFNSTSCWCSLNYYYCSQLAHCSMCYAAACCRRRRCRWLLLEAFAILLPQLRNWHKTKDSTADCVWIPLKRIRFQRENCHTAGRVCLVRHSEVLKYSSHANYATCSCCCCCVSFTSFNVSLGL